MFLQQFEATPRERLEIPNIQPGCKRISADSCDERHSSMGFSIVIFVGAPTRCFGIDLHPVSSGRMGLSAALSGHASSSAPKKISLFGLTSTVAALAFCFTRRLDLP
jgi:hypothetical protein